MKDIPSIDKLLNLSTNKGKAETVVMIPIKEISNFPNHPFKVENNAELQEMIESVKANGITNPVLVRRKEDGKYEMVSGHRIKLASEIAGLQTIPAIIRDLSREEATILMVDSNIQREKVLPSERAYAYKMKLDAIKNQGKRNDLTSPQLVSKLRSDEKVGATNGDSKETVRRYIRLTELIKEILDMVDAGKVAFSPAVEISYLNKDEQYVLYDYMKRFDATPSQAQAILLKKLSQEGKLDTGKIEEIISEEKPNQKQKYEINYNRFEKYLPRDVVTKSEVEDFLFTCVEEHFNRQRQKQRARER